MSHSRGHNTALSQKDKRAKPGSFQSNAISHIEKALGRKVFSRSF